ncbi:MAG: hypothetical protein JXR77_02675 [Lentisphaeria bacterium]|nr:hypothetical protein [Lentisphaeria bacterium]
MQRVLLATVMLVLVASLSADLYHAVYRTTESETFDYHTDKATGGWYSDTDKKDMGYLLVQYHCDAQGEFTLTDLAWFWIWKEGKTRLYDWWWSGSNGYRLVAFGDGNAALVHGYGCTKNLVAFETMILTGRTAGPYIPAMAGTQLTYEEGHEVEREEFKCKLDKTATEAAMAAASGAADPMIAAIHALRDYLEGRGYEED